MANIAHWRDVPKVATLMVSAKPITLWNGSVGVIRAGLGPDATSPWNKIAQIEKTMTKVCNNKMTFQFSENQTKWAA